eukprot:CAMPEP_0176476514 /NCGR_PEP_ID=MMETSP0200_2-20121128/92_1 /TAXON_ID=947934 /ORGANISM="Chaetoceros sp., Strain GSL56" /LENGTH=858 /DNA_ID=CAMNT_0017872187 /DNA_START=265 /DNA_END=2841 /DNA_ORIENTATION=+
MSSQTSTDSTIVSELEKATKLEAQLKSLLASDLNTESKASEIRIKLCEVFSDVLLTDCTTALRKDVTSRLWYSCFYNRIQELRQRIAKEKNRARKQSANGDVDDKGKVRIKQAEQSLKNFIQEGIMLYNFLVDRLQGSLLPPEETLSQSQSSENSQPYSKGTVPALHKLYIHLGDMHRYASSFSDAEHTYLQASKLAPSKGNPYNQLAVVAQLKETNGYPLPAMALYWYCRSLLSYEVFETSKGNIERLFAANEKWLKNNGSSFNVSSPTLQEALQGTNKEDARQIKSTASRMVLSRFVSFHGLLYQNKIDNLEEDLLLQRYREILDVNPFGDGLMIKLVVINVFSVWNAQNNPSIFSIAFRFILKFTGHICQSMESIVEKTHAKIEKTGKVTNVRLLGPVLLACEFVSREILNNNAIQRRLETDPFYEKDLEEFWTNIGKLSSKMSKLQELCPDLKAQSDALSIPEDFKSLSMGCKPFAFLDSAKEQNTEWAYVDQSGAIEALELRVSQTQSQVTPRSKKQDISSESGDAETRIKFTRFMTFVKKHIESGDLVETSEGYFAPACLVPNNKHHDSGIVENSSTVDQVMEVSSIASQDKDVLVYKQSRKGEPALLVPSKLLTGESSQDQDVKMDDGSDLLKLSDIIDKNMKEKAEQIISPVQFDISTGNEYEVEQPLRQDVPGLASVRPPPGFHSANVIPQPLPIQSSPQLRSVETQVTNQNNPNFGFLQDHQNYTFGGLSSFVDRPSQPILQNPQDHHSMFKSTHKLPETRNPFVSRLTQSYGIDTSINHMSGSINAQTLGGHELLPDLNRIDNGGLHEHDPFGLKALGIFSPNEKSMVNDRNTFGRNVETGNPFYLG